MPFLDSCGFVQHPSPQLLSVRQAQSLQETKEKLATSLEDAVAFVEGVPHKRLWQLLAKQALQQHNFPLAIKALVLKDDYKSVQFVKQVRQSEKLCMAFVMHHLKQLPETVMFQA
jgi:hypothetical protein